MAKEKEEEQSLKGYIIGFIFNSLCSLALPVGLSFYFAPEKSMEYFQNTVQDKIDSVASIDWEAIYDFGKAILDEIPPMLQTEYDVLAVIVESVPPVVTATVSSIIALDLDYRIGGSIIVTLLLATAIAYFFFPFQDVKEWITNVLWGSVCIVSGFLPLDNGMDVLADKDAGMYKMAVTLSAVIVTLMANYIVVIAVSWISGKALSFLWSRLVGLIFKKKSTDSKKGKEKTSISKSISKENIPAAVVEEEKEEIQVEKKEEEPVLDGANEGVGKDEWSPESNSLTAH